MIAIPPVDGLTISAALRRAAAQYPDHEALVFREQGLRVTYAEYDRRADEVARALLALGVHRGDHVAVWATNRPEWPLLFLATARIGAVLVTVNPAYRSEQLAHVLDRSDAKALFCVERFGGQDLASGIEEVRARLPALRWVVTLEDVAPAGLLPWPHFLGLGDAASLRELEAREAASSPSDPAALLYTSGAAGVLKGALLTHRNVLLNAWYVGKNLRLGTADRVCAPTPFHHGLGALTGLLGTLVHQATLLVPSELFDAGAVLRCVEEERATALYGLPSMFLAELEHEERHTRRLTSLRTGVLVGGPEATEIASRVTQELGVPELTRAHGRVETSPIIVQTRADDPEEIRIGTVGRPLTGVEVRVVHPGTLAPVAPGEWGELQTRGHNVMLGYHRQPETTKESVLGEGWLRTGDGALLDTGGNLRITGPIQGLPRAAGNGRLVGSTPGPGRPSPWRRDHEAG
jgi:fatty-acyl-CoA synthase